MMIKGLIIILGSPNDDKGNLSSIAVERCSKAFVEHKKNPEYALLPTGGWGHHFNTTNKPHGDYVKEQLIAWGVPEERFLPCVESSSTIEDAGLAHPILDAHLDAHLDADIIVVTSDFHADRAKFLFEREFPDREITISTSVTDLQDDELVKLRAHEKKAIERLEQKGGSGNLNVP